MITPAPREPGRSARSTPPARILDRIACPSALSVPVWLLAFAPSVTTAVLHDRNLFGGSLLAWFLVAIVGALAAGAVLALASFLLGPRRPVAAILLVFVIAGVARGVGVGLSAQALGLAPDPQLEVRALSGAILGIFWLSIATVLVDGFRRHRHAREELEHATEAAERDLDRAQADLHSLQSRMQFDVFSQVVGVVRDLERLPEDDDDAAAELARIATRLHDLASTVVRPISHEAHATRIATPVRPSRWSAYRAIAVDAVTVDPFRPDWLVLLLLPSILMTAIRAYGPIPGTLGATSIVLMGALVLTVARRMLTPRLHRWRRAARFIVVPTVWLLAALASSLPVAVSADWPISPERSWAVFGVPLLAYVPATCLGIAIGTAIWSSWAIDEDAQATRIATLTWQARLDEQRAWATRQQWGRYLHGSVQSALTSTALVIEMQARAGAPASDIAVVALERLRPLQAADAGEVATVIDVEEILGQIIDVWSRVARITMTVDDGARELLAQEASAAERAVEISREAISNAIRHGRARQVAIEVDADDARSVLLHIADDGQTGTSAGTSRGLGSRLLDEWCMEWQRGPAPDGGTVLQCRVALDATAAAQPV